MPLVIKVVERVDDAQPGIMYVSIRLVERPVFAAPREPTQLLEKGPAVPAVVGQAGVTHLVNQDTPLSLWWKPALNDDPMMRRLIEAVAAVGEEERAPHRAASDAAVEELGVQPIEKQF